MMVAATDDFSADYRLGWQAALLAVQSWHEAQAKKALVQARRSRFPKNLERESDVHKHAAAMVVTLSPEDV